jgi:predicted ATPase
VTGRERELGTLADLLARNRTLSIVGEGGIGKTWLALALAAELRQTFPDGVWFVPIAGADDDLVPALVAQAIGVRSVHGSPLEHTIADALEQVRGLVILDHAQAAPNGVASVAWRLYQTTHHLHVLITSRTPPNLAGAVFRVPPLEDGLRLFTDRVHTEAPNLAFDEAFTQMAKQIVRRLHGNPLAIELVAAQSAKLVADLEAGPYKTDWVQAFDRPIDWAFDRLGPNEQRFFTRLGVFDGSFDEEDCAAVAHDAEIAAGAQEVLHTLVSQWFVSRSLSAHQPQRYILNDELRAFAQKQLKANPSERTATVRRYTTHYRELAQRLDLSKVTDEKAALRRLIDEHANVTGTLHLLFDDKNELAAAREMVVSLRRYWLVCDLLNEARRSVDRALEPPDPEPALRAELLREATTLARGAGELQHAATLGKQLVQLLESSGNGVALGEALILLGTTKADLNDTGEAETLYRRALDEFRKAGDGRRTANALYHLGLVLAERHNERVAARKFFDEAVGLLRQEAPSRALADAIANLGALDALEQQHAGAIQKAVEAIAIYEPLGERAQLAWQSIALTEYLIVTGDRTKAYAHLAAAKQALREQPHPAYRALYHDAAVRLAAALGANELAAELHGHAEHYRTLEKLPRTPEDLKATAQRLAIVEHILGREVFAHLQHKGMAAKAADFDEPVDKLKARAIASQALVK